MNKACCFAGHRYPWRNIGIEEKLYQTIKNLILDGYDTFYDGNYGDFDELCKKCVLKLKNKYQHIKLILVLTYYHSDKSKYEIPNYYDGSVYPDLECLHPKQIIIERNKWIVDNGDIVVANISDEKSLGAMRTIKYAQKQNKLIVFIDL